MTNEHLHYTALICNLVDSNRKIIINIINGEIYFGQVYLVKKPHSCTLRMADKRLAHGISKLQNLPSISLPTDYHHHSGSHNLVEAAHNANLSEQTCTSLLKLTLYYETEGNNNNNLEDEDGEQIASKRPSGFHLLLAAFTVLLHRYTGDTDLVIGSSSAYKQDSVVLRFPVDPQDPFWAAVRRVQLCNPIDP